MQTKTILYSVSHNLKKILNGFLFFYLKFIEKASFGASKFWIPLECPAKAVRYFTKFVRCCFRNDPY